VCVYVYVRLCCRLENKILLYSLVPEHMVAELKNKQMQLASPQAPKDVLFMSTPAEVRQTRMHGHLHAETYKPGPMQGDAHRKEESGQIAGCTVSGPDWLT
jgi:hypothetical protein